MTIQLNKRKFTFSDGWDSDYIAALIDAMGKADKYQAKSIHNIVTDCEDWLMDLRETDTLREFFDFYASLVPTGEACEGLLHPRVREKYFTEYRTTYVNKSKTKL